MDDNLPYSGGLRVGGLGFLMISWDFLNDIFWNSSHTHCTHQVHHFGRPLILVSFLVGGFCMGIWRPLRTMV